MKAVTTRGLGKRYKVYDRPRDRLLDWLTGSQRHRSLWAIRDLDLEVAPGEALGIIGQNGAGKSTLLKMLAGTVEPTEGTMIVHGRVAALLELGIAFHSEFSGRQNAMMTCQLSGLPDSEARRLLPEIESFSELSAHFDQPVRTYSSGMLLRLAFATATAARPEVLIVDEALAVGDAYFQYKCFQRIQSFLAAGTSLLFVSHDPNAVLNLCNRAVLVQDGHLVMDDTARLVLEYYQGLTLKSIEQQNRPGARSVEIGRVAGETGKETSDGIGGRERYVLDAGAIEGVEVDLLDAADQPVAHLVSGAVLKVRIRVRFAKDFADPHIGFGIKDKRGLTIFDTNTYCSRVETKPVQAGGRLTATFSMRCNLQEGDYFVVVGVANGASGNGTFENSLFFDNARRRVTLMRPDRGRIWAGIVDLAPEITLEDD